jgi:hypothetical protein
MKRFHIYSAPMQPATKWHDCHDDSLVIEWPANKLLFCDCCNKRWPAKNVVVQSYYDYTARWCAPDKGCNDPKRVAAKKRAEFKRRSDGQKARYSK